MQDSAPAARMLPSLADLHELIQQEDGSENDLSESTESVDSEQRMQMECTLVWRDVRYSIFSEDFMFHSRLASIIPWIRAPKKQRILKNISGYAEPGKFLGIIGSSGAGKTTLLNILANSLTKGELKGTIEANGVSIRSLTPISKYKKIVGFVAQHDSLLPFLTVKETLFYAGMLSLPRNMSFLTKLEKIDQLIFELGLDKCSSTYVGNQLLRGISGGEMKRLSIGVELLREPTVLLLDEPTSGLDSRSALQLCKNLSRLAKKFNHTVIAVIHQPRSQIVRLFDDLLVLAPGGKQIYFGKRSNVIGYFNSKGYECPERENPTDYILDSTTVDFSNIRARTESNNRIDELANKWCQHPEPECINDNGFSDENSKDTKRASIFWQCFWLTMRESVNESRNHRYLFTRFFQSFAVSLFLAILLIRLNDNQASIHDRLSVCYFAILTIAFNELTASIAVFLSHSNVYNRERKNGLYHPFSYWVAKQFALLPYQLLFPGIWIFIIYWISGLQTEWYKFAIFFGILELVAFFCNSIGLILGTVFPPSISTVCGPLIVVLSSVVSGFVKNLDNMSPFFYGVSHISFARWAFEALIINEFTGLSLTCDSNELVGNDVCPYTNGDDVIDSFSFAELEMYQYMLIILAPTLFLRTALYFVLRYGSNNG